MYLHTRVSVHTHIHNLFARSLTNIRTLTQTEAAAEGIAWRKQEVEGFKVWALGSHQTPRS